MDDHMYDDMLNYAECEMIPRFQKEYEEHGTMAACPSYQEMKELCTVLNAVAPYAGYPRTSPGALLKKWE